MEQAGVLVTFVISNDCDKFQGVQYQVGIAAHKNSADKWSCWSVINHNKHGEKYKPKDLVK